MPGDKQDIIPYQAGTIAVTDICIPKIFYSTIKGGSWPWEEVGDYTYDTLMVMNSLHDLLRIKL